MDEEFVFNGLHLGITFVAVIIGFACGTIYGWLLRDERDRR